jgi:hypothetical protein
MVMGFFRKEPTMVENGDLENPTMAKNKKKSYNVKEN